ncbi:hypothetical protein [Aquimarina sp. RZ0]|uniref:hypothetical protein n=1 Tax=Aquimarina sp. RZ0 TaxID=2607730 RepID=UPI0011F30F6E|nr:hypothetical protein [Aquimarina sp. RZ0]KAA1247606.1 hypothetical protein F0000_02015 [Aquimarina sp. RZ0]
MNRISIYPKRVNQANLLLIRYKKTATSSINMTIFTVFLKLTLYLTRKTFPCYRDFILHILWRLTTDDKNTITKIIDAFIRDTKTKKAYAA